MSISGVVIALLIPLAVAWAFLALDSLVYSVVATILVAVPVWTYTLVRASEQIVVRADGLRVGKAWLERDWIGDVEDFSGAAWNEMLRNAGHSRSWLATRSFHPGGVRITNTDDSDHIEQWLVSSRNPVALAAAIRQTKQELAN